MIALLSKSTHQRAQTLATAGLLCGAALGASNALAAATITIVQSGANVVATMSGSVNTTGVSTGPSGYSSGVIPGFAFVSSGGSVIEFSGLSGPSNWGSSTNQVFATSTTGDVFGIFGSISRLALPPGYVSGSALSGTVTLANQTMATLGLTPGTYHYTWGSGANADSLDVVISPPNAAPTASAVSISGSAHVGSPLNGTYSYSDAESDPQGSSTFRWIRNSVNSGIGGGSTVANTTGYTPVAADAGSYLYFCVTPVASTGTATGDEVCSSASTAVSAADKQAIPTLGQWGLLALGALLGLSTLWSRRRHG